MNPDRLWRWGLIASLLIFSLAALRFAAPAGANYYSAAPSSVATVNVVAIFDALEERKDQAGQFTQRGEEMRTTLEGLRAQLQELDAEVKDAATSDARRAELLVRMARINGEVEIRDELFGRELSRLRSETQIRLFNKVREAVAEFAKREGYDLVLSDDSSVELPAVMSMAETEAAIIRRRVLYHADAVDISEAVIRQMNNAYRASAGGASPR